VAGIRFERTELTGEGTVRGTGTFIDYPVQAVYRAVGYFGSELPEVGFDSRRGVIPNEGGRVIDQEGNPVPGIYATGWIKRGPVGLIGHTKGDALETIGFLLEDRLNLPAAEDPSENAITDLLESRGVQYTTWEGWLRLDAHELKLGANFVNETGNGDLVRERVKLVPREDMIAISRGE
jgi:ferredoxin--NADP+ reductase